MGWHSRPALQEAQQRIAELTADAEENVSGVRVIKAFAQEDRQLKRFQHSVVRVFDQQMTATRIQARYTPLISFLPNLGLVLILLVGGRDVIDGSLTIGQFTAFYAYLLMLISPMRTLGYMLSAAQRATASGARIFQVLDRAPAITSPENAPPLPEGPGRVSLRDVSLTFPGSSQPALHDVDLEIEPGRTVALVGAMGSGKTALVSLLSRLYEVSSGRCGSTARTSARSTSTACAGRSRSSPTTRSCSRRRSTTTSPTRGATRRARRFERAAQAAQAANFIEALPEGLRDDGRRARTDPFGGQRQRIAIARAVLADPRILVLDDATSSVDASTEQEIKLALGEVMAGRTTFVIAHRLSTIALADEIVVLEHGSVAAHGTHDELLEQSDLYREIVEKGMPDQVFLTQNTLGAVGL